MKTTLFAVALTCIATSAWASPPQHRSHLKGGLPPEIRLAPPTPAAVGPATEFDPIAITGHFDTPQVYYVITRAVPTWNDLQQTKDFVPGIIANATKRPF